ncbi:MAG TPA: hypothetical protein VN696_07715 [Pyrinomonadaceae bacterium]|nr:hypothetical protein [Pyrinomonadaceae bacterium]
MATGNINYNAVLADLEARKTQIESAIAAVKTILASAGVLGDGSTGGVISPDNIPVGAFLRLSIADATKKFLDMVKTKQSVPQITQALEKGGLPPAKTNTVYAVLRRRESDIGDIIRLGDEWALAEWYPNNPNLRKRTEKPTKSGKKRSKKKAPKAAKTPSKADAAEKILLAERPLHAKLIAERLVAEHGKNATSQSVAAALHQDPKKRFKNIGENTWDLVTPPPEK